MKSQMPFAPRGGCFVLDGDALVPQGIKPSGSVRIAGAFTVATREAIAVPADGGASPPLAGDGTGEALPEATPPDDGCGACADGCEQSPDGCKVQSESPPIDAPAPRRRRRK